MLFFALFETRRRIPKWLWDEMKNIYAPRYESTVDACINPLIHVIFPEECSFTVAAHHKVREEAHGTGTQQPEDRSFFDFIVKRAAGITAEPEDFGEPLFGDGNPFDPPIHSTPRTSRVTTPSADDSSVSLELPPGWQNEYLKYNSSNEQMEDFIRPAFGRPHPSVDTVSHATTPASATPTPASTPPEHNQSITIDDPSAQISWSSTDSGAHISLDDSNRRVPSRSQARAPHGIPDFLVLKRRTREVILVVEDKLHDDPYSQLDDHSNLFPSSLEISFFGCRLGPQGGLQFTLLTRNRTSKARPHLEPLLEPGDGGDNGWYPWNSVHIHRELRALADREWEAAEYYEDEEVPLVWSPV
ncbi:hypothetical protein C8Q74DRAFT_1295901 [Fomes fomentarius]|nr:hypothetical protein C8Q74DRAFT_1295901 [Fomes fomentarius]